MTWTADRPEAAHRDCSQARWRQDCEHHFRSLRVALIVTDPPHHPHVDAACLRPGVTDSIHGAESALASPDAEALGCVGDRGRASETGVMHLDVCAYQR